MRFLSLLIGVCVAILAGNSANLADALGIVGIPPLIGIIAGGVLIALAVTGSMNYSSYGVRVLNG